MILVGMNRVLGLHPGVWFRLGSRVAGLGQVRFPVLLEGSWVIIREDVCV